MQSDVVNPRAKKSSLLRLSGSLITSWDDCRWIALVKRSPHALRLTPTVRIAPPSQPEHEAAEARLQGLPRIEFTHDTDSPCAKDMGDLQVSSPLQVPRTAIDVHLQDTNRTLAELEPAETSSKGVLEIASAHGYPSGGELLPQPLYRPHQNDRRIHHATQVQLEAPILFFMQNRTVLGIPLKDAFSSRFVHLDGREDPMFTDHGPSVSIRLLVSNSCFRHELENV